MTKNSLWAVIVYAMERLAHGTPNTNARLVIDPDVNTILFFINCHLCNKPGRL
jgi:hypothetical protein